MGTKRDKGEVDLEARIVHHRNSIGSIGFMSRGCVRGRAQKQRPQRWVLCRHSGHGPTVVPQQRSLTG